MNDIDREAKRIVSEDYMREILLDFATKPQTVNPEWHAMMRRRVSAICQDWREAVGEE